MGIRALLRCLTFAVAVTAPTSAGAVPIDDLHVGTVLTLQTPATYRAGTPFTVSGHLRFQVGLPIVFETAQPLPNQPVDVFLGEERMATVTTGTDGSWRTALQIGSMPPYVRTLRAVAFAGSPLETRSRTATIQRDIVFSEVRIESAGTLSVGGTMQLRAVALDGDGREHVVTEETSWSSADPSVASVSNAAGARGLVTGVAPGTTTITATFEAFDATIAISVG